MGIAEHPILRSFWKDVKGEANEWDDGILLWGSIAAL